MSNKNFLDFEVNMGLVCAYWIRFVFRGNRGCFPACWSLRVKSGPEISFEIHGQLEHS